MQAEPQQQQVVSEKTQSNAADEEDGLLHLTLRCDVNLHSEHCMPGSLTKPALRTPQHQSNDNQHGDGLREGV